MHTASELARTVALRNLRSGSYFRIRFEQFADRYHGGQSRVAGDDQRRIDRHHPADQEGDDDQAEQMEAVEIRCLAGFGIQDPYAEIEGAPDAD